MQYSNAHLSRIGVHSVGKIVAQNLNWIFREQPTDDYGIDAQIEICKNGKPTGQLIALQIKCGDSYFSEKTTSGFLYRGSLRHLEYWLKHSLPVVLVVYHTLLDKAFWAYIDSTKISLHENSWTIEIRNVSVLDANSIPSLEALVSAGYHCIPVCVSKILYKVGVKKARVGTQIPTPQLNNDPQGSYFQPRKRLLLLRLRAERSDHDNDKSTQQFSLSLCKYHLEHNWPVRQRIPAQSTKTLKIQLPYPGRHKQRPPYKAIEKAEIP